MILFYSLSHYIYIYPYILIAQYTMISHFSCLNPGTASTCQAHAEITKLCVGRAQIFRHGRHIGLTMLVNPSLEQTQILLVTNGIAL